MATYTIKINERTQTGKTLLAYLMSLGIIKEEKEDEAYNPEFVRKIKKGEKEFSEGKCKFIKTEDIWK